MTASFITVSQGGPKPEDDIPDGVYLMQLVEVSDPRTVTAQKGPNAGKDFDLIDWKFAIDSPGDPLHDRIAEGVTSTASGPKSKMYAWLTALLGGRPPQIGQQFGKQDLVGRYALGTIAHEDGGWPRIAQLGAVPPAMLGQRLAQSTGTPQQGAPAAEVPATPVGAFTQPAVQAVPVGTAAPADDLPF